MTDDELFSVYLEMVKTRLANKKRAGRARRNDVNHASILDAAQHSRNVAEVAARLNISVPTVCLRLSESPETKTVVKHILSANRRNMRSATKESV